MDETWTIRVGDHRLDDRRTRSPVGARADRRGVRLDDAVRALPVDDAHHDGPRARAGELGDHGNSKSADVKGDGDEEAVVLVERISVGGRCRENVEVAERVRVEPRSVPGIESVRHDVDGLTGADYAGEPMDIGFNASYLRDILTVLPAGPVTLALADGGAPGLITSPGFEGLTLIAMPMRI